MMFISLLYYNYELEITKGSSCRRTYEDEQGGAAETDQLELD